MKMRLKCEEPDNIVFTITATATAREWGPLDQVHYFRSQIDNLLGQARKIYWPPEASEADHG